MTYKCLSCGHIFEDGEQSIWEEKQGLDTPPYEQFYCCPKCNGDYEKTVKCAICGLEHFEDDLIGGVCENCIDDHRHNFDICYKIGDIEKTEIKINMLLASLFDKYDIEAILYNYVKEKCPDIDCSPFIDNDVSWFAERLAEEVKKSENGKN